MTIVIDTEIIELFRIQWWHLQCKFGIKVMLIHTVMILTDDDVGDSDEKHVDDNENINLAG